jgi:hypothetical protein
VISFAAACIRNAAAMPKSSMSTSLLSYNTSNSEMPKAALAEWRLGKHDIDRDAVSPAKDQCGSEGV